MPDKPTSHDAAENASTRDRSARRKPAGRPSFRRLATRIAGWTSSLIVSGLILVVGLAGGRHVLHWWRGDSPHSAAPAGPTEIAGDPRAAAWHRVEVGQQPWAMDVRSLSGDRAAADKSLRDACVAAIAAAAPPQSPPPPAEQALLTRLSPKTLVEANPDGWEVHSLAGLAAGRNGLPMVAVVRRASASNARTRPLLARYADGHKLVGGSMAEDEPATSASSASSQPAATAASAAQSRQSADYVAIWGLALPAGAKSWTTYVFVPTKTEAGPSAAAVNDVPLPSGAERSLALRTDGGGAIVSFHGSAESEQWQRQFDRFLADGGWRAEGWRRSGEGWYLRAVRGGQRPSTVDIRFAPGAGGGLEGIVLITPRGAILTESNNP